jgi:hypothetical protein
MNKPMMRCGHAANAIDGNGKDCCVICAPDPSAYEVVEVDLSDRKARCEYYGETIGYKGSCDYPKSVRTEDKVCRCEANSTSNLPFFNSKPDKEFDSFYCGCAFGWD